MISFTPAERDELIRNVWGEARGEPDSGRAGVAWVHVNRAATPSWWGHSLGEVCLKPFQFSCRNAGDPNLPKLLALDPDGADYLSIARIVDGVLHGTIADPTGGATHYEVTGTRASWDKAAAATTPVVIGHHSFYKLGPSA